MNQNITDFFTERKATWLKAKSKPSQTDEEQAQLQQDAEDRFALATWLPDAAKRAGQLSMVSHPSAKTSSIIASSQRVDDGYLRTGNVEYELDVFGNAAAMDVYKFLSLLMGDGLSVLKHLESDSPAIQALFTIPTASYDSLKQGFISVKALDSSSKTDHMVKQVYFPVPDGYHLLSVLTPSGLLTQVKNRVDSIRFSEETKQAKECRKKNETHADGYDDIFDLTVTAYGGTQPQNVSVLNSKNAGRAYLLFSTPPTLKQRQTRLPTKNFFRTNLQTKQFKESFQTLDRLIQCPIKNADIKEGIRNTLKYIIDQVLQRAFSVRSNSVGWSQTEHYQSLPLAQRIWLDDANLEQRQIQEDWLDDVVAAFARWILDTYEYLFKETYITLSDYELREVRGFVEQAVSRDKEFFK